MNDFQQPHTQTDGDKAEWARMLGHLILVYATEYVDNIATVHGPSDAVKADIVILQGPNGQPISGPDGHPPILRDTMIFPKALKSQTKNAVGDTPVLGRITQGEAKAGNSAPWLISNFTDAEAQYAQQYINSHPRTQPQQPAAAQAPPAAPVWGQPAAPPAPAWGQQPQQAAAAVQSWGQPPAGPTPVPTGWGNPPPTIPGAAPGMSAPAATPVANWGQPQQAAAPPFGGPINPALAGQLQQLNVPVDQILTDDQARQIIAQLGQQPAA